MPFFNSCQSSQEHESLSFYSYYYFFSSIHSLNDRLSICICDDCYTHVLLLSLLLIAVILLLLCLSSPLFRRISEDEKHFMFIPPIRRLSERKSIGPSGVPGDSITSNLLTRMIIPGITVTQPLLLKNDPAAAANLQRTPSTYYSRELKAFRTLTAIAVAFLVSWLPFFILALIRPFYDGIPKWATALTLWLGYFNSTVNPILYSIFNKDFRRPFAELLRCRCCSLKRIIRAEAYEAQFGQMPFRSPSVAASEYRANGHAVNNTAAPTPEVTRKAEMVTVWVKRDVEL